MAHLVIAAFVNKVAGARLQNAAGDFVLVGVGKHVEAPNVFDSPDEAQIARLTTAKCLMPMSDAPAFRTPALPPKPAAVSHGKPQSGDPTTEGVGGSNGTGEAGAGAGGPLTQGDGSAGSGANDGTAIVDESGAGSGLGLSTADDVESGEGEGLGEPGAGARALDQANAGDAGGGGSASGSASSPVDDPDSDPARPTDPAPGADSGNRPNAGQTSAGNRRSRKSRTP